MGLESQKYQNPFAFEYLQSQKMLMFHTDSFLSLHTLKTEKIKTKYPTALVLGWQGSTAC